MTQRMRFGITTHAQNDRILTLLQNEGMSLSLFDLSGRVAVVAGGTSGIGRTLALGLAQAGADVIATGRRANLVAEVAAEIEAAGRRTITHAVDASSRESVDAFRDAVLARFPRVDILVNAAGQTFRQQTHTVAEEDWNRIMDVNVTGTLRTCQSFFEPLQASGHGRVINIASLTSFVAFREVTAYAASKAAVLGFTRNLAIEWAPLGINVNAIAPGVFRTELNSALLDGTERGRELLLRTPMKRFGGTEELVGTAILLAGDASSFITGQCITVDGGFLASGVNTV
jgi:NAD(P)-dependent dehydrogenase (short-subunit alcohol dehydrogenase family)